MMKTALGFLVAILFAGASISYFKYSRDVQVSGSAPQVYAVVDETLWQHSRPDLGDLRLDPGDNEIPYALMIERGSSEHQEKDVRVLQPGTIGGKTQFFLEMEGLAEYDRIQLKLSARDFVVKAQVEGSDDLHGTKWANLARTVLYDLSSDSLGGNSTLRLPLTTYRYLRVTLEGQVKASDVQGASAAVRHEEKEVWKNVGVDAKPEREGKDTLLTFTVPANVPVERLELAIDPAQSNFRRSVQVLGEKKEYIGSGELSRVHMVRYGQKIDQEQYTLSLYATGPQSLKVTIHNGDDPPLKITGAHLQQYERRLYFTPPRSGSAHLYYGDEKLDSPVYDFAKLFQKDTKAVAVPLGPEQANTAYTGRPDDRPWSERHPAVLWIAIILAVLVLGGLALRSMKTAAA